MCEAVPTKRGVLNFRRFDATVLSEWMVAVREETCCACGETVHVGEPYHAEWRALILIHSARHIHCVRCWKMFEALLHRVDKGCAVRYALDCGQTWDSAFGEEPPEDVAALAFALPGDFSFDVDADGKVTETSQGDI